MSVLVEAVLLGVVIGAVLGSLGGGGAVLAVPGLVYLVGQPATEATTTSLLVVGASAVAGVLAAQRCRQVDWRTGVLFGAIGVLGTAVGAELSRAVAEPVLLLAFAVLMVVAAAAMWRDSRKPASSRAAGGDEAQQRPMRWGRLLLVATGVGLLTGFFGVGGGFVVVPALVLALELPMSLAVGTSLLVVAINSATAFAARAWSAPSVVDWQVVLPFGIAAVVATVTFKEVAKGWPAQRLKGGFAVLLVLVALYTGGHSAAALWV